MIAGDLLGERARLTPEKLALGTRLTALEIAHVIQDSGLEVAPSRRGGSQRSVL